MVLVRVERDLLTGRKVQLQDALIGHLALAGVILGQLAPSGTFLLVSRSRFSGSSPPPALGR